PAYFGEAITEHAADAVWVGDLLSPNLEAIALLEPDLILTAAARHEEVYDELSAIAPTIATESAGAGWKDNLRLTAAASGATERADELIAEYESRAATTGATINEVADSPTISVVRFLDVIRLYQPASFSGTVLADAGLARPDSQQDPEEFMQVISEEELGRADADVLIYTVFDDAAVAEQVDEMQERPLWGTLGAVQRGDVHAVSDDHWMSGVGIFGAHLILDDLESIFGLPPSRTPSTSVSLPEPAGSAPPPDADGGGTVLEVAAGAGAGIVAGYAGFAPGFNEAVSGAGPVTVLMPNDDAFAAFTAAYPVLTESLRVDLELLDQLLLYHTVDGAELTAAIDAGTTLATRQGEEITVTLADGVVVLNGGQARIVQADLAASNGVVHLIDGILLPPSIAATAE
ncbi:MAG: fasciclin domain-containing protein, partial [Desertimonas sp.]